MTDLTTSRPLDWVPPACTLPTAEQPLRLEEFDALFTDHVTEIRRDGPMRVTLSLDGGPQVAMTAADLAARETDCCSFFTFDLRITEGTLSLAVSTADGHADVIAALAQRAEGLAKAAK